MKAFVLLSALTLALPAFAVEPFTQSTVTLPDGRLLDMKCNPQDKPTHYRLELTAHRGSAYTFDLAARPYCPARLAALQGKNVLHVVLGFTGHERSATVLDVGDSDHNLEEMKGMELQEGETKSAEWNGNQYRVTRLP